MHEKGVAKFWIYVRRKNNKDEIGFGKHELLILPFHHRLNPTSIKRLAFRCQRLYPTIEAAKKEAKYLFGQVIWESCGDQGTERAKLRLGIESN